MPDPALEDRRRRVYFFVGKAVVHPVYKEAIRSVPPGVTYLPSHPDLAPDSGMKGDIQRRGTLRDSASRHGKAAVVAALGRLGYIRRIRLEAPPAELIHSAQYLLRKAPLPYVVDFEDVSVFAMYQSGALRRPFATARLIRALEDERLRYLLPWTDAAGRGLTATLGADRCAPIAERVVTVRPAIEPRVDRPRERGKALRILFVGSTFYGKGGVEAIRAVQRARRSQEVELDLVTFPPPSWADEFQERGPIRFHTRIPPAALDRLYDEADVLLFPTHTDTLGFVVLEAMARALPVVASTHFALPELVEDGESGLLFPHENSLYGPDFRPRFPWFHGTRYPREFVASLRTPSDGYVDGIASRLVRLAEDDGLYRALSNGALKSVRTGALSMQTRRRQLSDVYERAME